MMDFESAHHTLSRIDGSQPGKRFMICSLTLWALEASVLENMPPRYVSTQSSDSRTARYTLTRPPELRWSMTPLPSDNTSAMPWRTMEAIAGYRASTEVMVRSIKVIPEETGLAGERRERTVDHAPSAPMTRSTVSSCPLAKSNLCWDSVGKGIMLLTLWFYLTVSFSRESDEAGS